jgi:hypothetical protein
MAKAHVRENILARSRQRNDMIYGWIEGRISRGIFANFATAQMTNPPIPLRQ